MKTIAERKARKRQGHGQAKGSLKEDRTLREKYFSKDELQHLIGSLP